MPEYDHIVVGAGLSGLMLTRALEAGAAGYLTKSSAATEMTSLRPGRTGPGAFAWQ